MQPSAFVFRWIICAAFYARKVEYFQSAVYLGILIKTAFPHKPGHNCFLLSYLAQPDLLLFNQSYACFPSSDQTR